MDISTFRCHFLLEDGLNEILFENFNTSTFVHVPIYGGELGHNMHACIHFKTIIASSSTEEISAELTSLSLHDVPSSISKLFSAPNVYQIVGVLVLSLQCSEKWTTRGIISSIDIVKLALHPLCNRTELGTILLSKVGAVNLKFKLYMSFLFASL